MEWFKYLGVDFHVAGLNPYTCSYWLWGEKKKKQTQTNTIYYWDEGWFSKVVAHGVFVNGKKTILNITNNGKIKAELEEN